MTHLLSERAVPRLFPGATLRELSVASEDYRTAQTRVVLCRATFEGAAPSAKLLATFGAGGKMERAYQSHYAGREEPETRALYLREYDCLVELFPADFALPSLATALDPVVMAAKLSLPAPPAVELIYYRPHRRALLRYAGAGVALIGKIYRDVRLARRTWRILGEIDAAQRKKGRPLTPRPYAFLEEDSLLVMERSGGTPLHRLFASASDAEASAAVGAAATTLASLHALDIEVRVERSIERELTHTRRRIERLRAVEPDLAGAIDAQLDRVAPLVHDDRAEPFCFVHRDYNASQILIDGPHAVVVDFDRAARGDPALDVGNFLADLRRQALVTERDGLRGLAAGFLEAYCACAGVPGLAERARLAEIVSLARMAGRALRRAPREYLASPETSLSALLVREASACVEAL
jgi:aminoglycoside phosphotransferase (APT) family kinase protein